MRLGLVVVGLGLWACGAVVGRAQVVAAGAAAAQAGCGAEGYRVVARRWDAVLARGWEMRQDCAHPDWPARAVAVSGAVRASEVGLMGVRSVQAMAAAPLLVRAGERVRLWRRDAVVRIEMSGVAESSARDGERVVVRVTRETEDAGLATQEIAGVVRGAGDVEMVR